MPFDIAPATARIAWPKPVFGYVVDGAYAATVATRSSVASAACELPYTNASSGRSTGTCEEILIALLFSAVASVPLFGLLNEYCAALGMAGTATRFDCSTCGRLPVVFQPVNGSTGDGSESRYRPTQPSPAPFGSPVDQMSVPRKCERV